MTLSVLDKFLDSHAAPKRGLFEPFLCVREWRHAWTLYTCAGRGWIFVAEHLLSQRLDRFALNPLRR